MSIEGTRTSRFERADSDLWVLTGGMAAWVVVMAAYWPMAVSFGDEVGYLGEARLLLDGRLMPRAGDVGLWGPGVHGLVDRYPLFPSMLFSPLLALAPRAVFALGILTALVACWLVARALMSWGDRPVWALLLLAHPTVVIISRTATVDVPFCALMLGAWWALRWNRWTAAVLLFAGLFAIKATGFTVGGLLAAGEMWRRAPDLRRGDPEARKAIVVTAMAMAAGFVAIIVANELTTGRVWFGYDFSGARPFWPSHFPRTAPAQFRTLLLLPPLLFLGAVPLWRRRELGPLCVVVGFGTLMCFYFFVDSGTTRLESLVMAPRLLLPVVVFLLVGYAHQLAALARRIPGAERRLGPLLIATTVGITWTISARHVRWQRPMGEAIEAAQKIAGDLRVDELGVMDQAAKAGILFRGPTLLVGPSEANAPVVLCSDHSSSYREPRAGPPCDLSGYQQQYQSGGFSVLVREGSSRKR